MEAISILIAEHRLIRQFLETLAAAVSRMESGDNPRREFFEKAMTFAQTFADKYHHFKEEHVMFSHLAQKKEGAIDTYIDSLKQQHERARDHWAEVSKALDGYGRGGDTPTTIVIENTAAYVSLLRRHIHLEESIFFPLAQQCFSEEEHRRLLEEFGKAGERCGSDAVERGRQLVTELGNLLQTRSEVSTESPPLVR